MSEHAKAGHRDPSRSILGKNLLNYICQEVYKRKPRIVEGNLYKFLDIVDDQEIMIMGHGINNKIVCLFPCPPLYHLITKPDLLWICKLHSIKVKSRQTVEELNAALCSHRCQSCKTNYIVFSKNPKKLRLPTVAQKKML